MWSVAWRAALVVLALVAWGLLAASAEPWDPLADLGVSVAIAVTIVVGAAVAVGWWSCLVPVALLACGWVESSSAPPDRWGSTIVVVLIFGVPATMLAVGVRALVGRRLGERADRGVRRAGWVVVVAGVAATLVAAHLGTRVLDHVPRRPLVVTEPGGTIRGVALGDPIAVARGRLGRARIVSPRSAWLQEVAPDDYRGPGLVQRRRGRVLLHPDLAVATNAADRVAGLQTFDADAQTARGAGIGDSIAIVRRRHPDARCITPRRDTDFNQDAEPECSIALPRRRAITLWGDPVRTITVERR